MDEIGVHYVCAHMAVDTEQSDNNIEDFLKQLKNIKFKAKLALAGGIKTSNIANIAQYSPDLLVVGRAITPVSYTHLDVYKRQPCGLCDA